MLAGEIAQPYPVVGVTTNALEAARLLGKDRLPGLVVTDADGHPTAVLPASQVVRFVVPNYVQDDPALAGVVGERMADRLVDRLANSTVGELLPAEPQALPILRGGDTVLELAATMARMHSPLAAVVDGDRILGVVTAAHLLDVITSRAR